MRQCQWLVSPALALVLTLATFQQAGAESLVRKSAGVMAFGPDGVLFVADAKTALIGCGGFFFNSQGAILRRL